MLIQRPSDILPSEITPRVLFEKRRRLLLGAGYALAGAALWHGPLRYARGAVALTPLAASIFSTNEEKTSFKSITNYNNFVEFGSHKLSPAESAGKMAVRPWTVRVEGLVGKPRTFDIDELLRLVPLEERIYRLRCVEGWSMVIPWAGFPLAALLKQVEPLGSAKFVEFVTRYDPAVMTRIPILPWPYTEGLRLDEALHPLTLLAVGLYGEVLPNQNGAPIRLVVPWKYGFKGAKSIVAIRLVERQPATTWNRVARDEYGFYANVNPEVSHPRWSQATERRIGDFLKRPTLMFNGYGEQVADLYRGMDLRANY